MTRLDELLAEATNPKAYDANDVNWEQENGQGSTRQELYREYFNHPDSWRDKSVLDVGCGTGWLCNFFKQEGAGYVVGIEPSQKNLAYAAKHFAGIEFILSDLLSFQTADAYDVVSCVMVLMNLGSMAAVFSKLGELLKPSGELLIVVPDYEYFKTPRGDYKLEVLPMNDTEYVVRTQRPEYTVTDIVRCNQVYIAAAKKAGLKLVEGLPLTPTKAFRSDLLQYDEFRDVPIMHLLRFHKDHEPAA